MVTIGGRVADYHANQRINRQMGQVSGYIRIGAVLTRHAAALTVAEPLPLGSAMRFSRITVRPDQMGAYLASAHCEFPSPLSLA